VTDDIFVLSCLVSLKKPLDAATRHYDSNVICWSRLAGSSKGHRWYRGARIL